MIDNDLGLTFSAANGFPLSLEKGCLAIVLCVGPIVRQVWRVNNDQRTSPRSKLRYA
jgi:hypothetical protein